MPYTEGEIMGKNEEITKGSTIVLEETVHKTQMKASAAYDYHRLQAETYYFVPCNVEEKEESLCFTYELDGMTPLKEVKKSDRELIYSILIQAGELGEKARAFNFSLEPENLYYDAQNRLHVLRRDILEDGAVKDYFKEFQALAGALLQKKYNYSDYLNGGMDLLDRQEETRRILQWNSMDDALKDLSQRQRGLRSYERTHLCTIKKSRYRGMKAGMILFLVLAAAALAYTLYQHYKLIAPQRAALTAQRAYVESDYVAVIDSLKEVQPDALDVHEKYILAVSYIKGQAVDNFSSEAKDNILSRLNVKGDASVMDYWIYLGRLETKEAEDIALKMSDNQLLLYAYLQERDQVSRDSSLKGDEKAARMETLDGEIDKLAEKLGIQYDMSTEEE